MTKQHAPNYTIKNIKKYIHDYHFNSLLIRNFGLILLIVVLPIILCVLFYFYNMRNILNDEIANMSYNSLEQTVNIMDSTLEDAKQITINMSLREDVNLLKYLNLQQLKETPGTSRIIEDITLITSLYHCIDSIYIYYESNQLVFYDSQIIPLKYVSDCSWFPYYEETDSRKIYFQYREKKDFYPYLISLIYPIYSDTGHKVGAVITNINIENWGNVIEKNNTNTQLYCFDDELHMYYSNNFTLFSDGNTIPEHLYCLTNMPGNFTSQIKLGGESYIVSCLESSHKPLKYVSLIPASIYQYKIDHFNFTMQVILIIGIIFCFFVSLIMTFRTYVPVLSIMRLLNQETDNTTLSKRQRPDELFFIKDQVNNSKQKNIQLQEALTEQIRKLNHAQIGALQSQLDPHFLYNTLDTINWMAIKRFGGKNDISDMVSELGKLLQISLEKSEYLVSVKEEIEHTKIYLNILKKRYQNRLNIEWDIDEYLLDCKIVKLSLQPIVENAVIHGLRAKRYIGTILIQGKFIEDTAIISITDDGVGMTRAEIECLNKSLREEIDDADDSHIGLRNVHKRFVLLFGESYGITIQQPVTQDSGLTVLLKFPCL